MTNNDVRVICAALLTNSTCGVRWPFGIERAECATRLIGLDPGAYYVPGRGRRQDGGPPLGKDAARREAAVAAAVAAAAAGRRTLGTAPTEPELAASGFGRGETPRLRGDAHDSWGDLLRALAHDGAGLAAAIRIAAAAGVYPVPARGGQPPQEFVDVQPTTNGEARRWSF
jgi:hypothetical protein